MWNVKAKVIPIIIGATGTISISLRQHLSNITGKHKIKEIQKTAILDTVQLPWKVIVLKYETFNMEHNITFSMNCIYKIAATLCTLETWFVSGTDL